MELTVVQWSHCKIHQRLIFSLLRDRPTFSIRMLWQRAKFMFHQLQLVFQALKQHGSPRLSHYYHHASSYPWMLLASEQMKLFHKAPLVTDIIPQVLEVSKMFLAHLTSGSAFWVSTGLRLATLSWIPLLPCVFAIVASCTLTSAEVCVVCSSLDAWLGSPGWDVKVLLRGTLVDQPPLGKFSTFSL